MFLEAGAGQRGQTVDLYLQQLIPLSQDCCQAGKGLPPLLQDLCTTHPMMKPILLPPTFSALCRSVCKTIPLYKF
jgi:hypothetical protein